MLNVLPPGQPPLEGAAAVGDVGQVGEELVELLLHRHPELVHLEPHLDNVEVQVLGLEVAVVVVGGRAQGVESVVGVHHGCYLLAFCTPIIHPCTPICQPL